MVGKMWEHFQTSFQAGTGKFTDLDPERRLRRKWLQESAVLPSCVRVCVLHPELPFVLAKFDANGKLPYRAGVLIV